MAATREILVTARTALFSHAALWMPAFMTIILQDMVLPLWLVGGQPGQAVAGLMAAIGAAMIGAGWIAMIGAALRGEQPGLATFADGVNARWIPIVAGNIVYWLLILALAGLAFWYGHQTYGWDVMTDWFRKFIETPPEKRGVLLEPTRLSPAVQGWMNVIGLGLSAFLALNALLLFWQPIVVLRERGWLAAWAASARLLFARLGQVLALGALHLGGLFLARSLMASLQPVATLLGVALYVGVVAYFMIAYVAVVEDALPNEGRNVDVTA